MLVLPGSDLHSSEFYFNKSFFHVGRKFSAQTRTQTSPAVIEGKNLAVKNFDENGEKVFCLRCDGLLFITNLKFTPKNTHC